MLVPFQASDIPYAVHLEASIGKGFVKAWSYETYQAALQDPNYCLLKTESQSGFIIFYRTSQVVVDLKRIIVAKPGSGHGTLLIRDGILWARDSGYQKMTLDVLHQNVRAQKLYIKFGFNERHRGFEPAMQNILIYMDRSL